MTEISSLLIAVSFMAGLGLLLAAVLAVANRRLYVFEDPRIDQVEELLPSANCGSCGSAGCRAFAERLVKGEAQPGLCTVNSKEGNQLIANFLGVELGGAEKRVARLACAGGSNVARRRAGYAGLESCRAAATVAGGGKGCAWGCLGLGDCAEVCEFDALRMDVHALPRVDADKCTACGDCVEICPRDLFSLQPVSHRLWVACRNLEKGEEAEADCAVLCTACGRCAADAPEGLITIRDNLAVVDYSKNALASPLAVERCPTGAIVWLDDVAGVRRGRDAVKIVRKGALPLAGQPAQGARPGP